MFIFGAAGAAAVGQADISDVMIAQGLLLPAIIVLGLNIWTTNDNALYASGLGFANITGLSSRTLSVANGIIGTLCALWLYNNFVGWLTFLSAAIPPIGGVIIADLSAEPSPLCRLQQSAIYFRKLDSDPVRCTGHRRWSLYSRHRARQCRTRRRIQLYPAESTFQSQPC